MEGGFTLGFLLKQSKQNTKTNPPKDICSTNLKLVKCMAVSDKL